MIEEMDNDVLQRINDSSTQAAEEILTSLIETKRMTPSLLKALSLKIPDFPDYFCFNEVDTNSSVLRYLQGIEQIVSLNLDGLKNLIDQDLFFLNDIPNLKSLSMVKCLKIGSYGIQQITLCTLTSLDVSDTVVDDVAISHIVQTFKSLRTLQVSRTKVSDKGSKILAECKGNDIQHLNMKGCKGITNASCAILWNMNRIEHLNFTGTSVNKMGLNQLKEKLIKRPEVSTVQIKLVFLVEILYKTSMPKSHPKSEELTPTQTSKDIAQGILDSCSS